MRRILRILAVGYAALALGCGDPGKSENTGAPIELNKTKNAPAGYGAPDGAARGVNGNRDASSDTAHEPLPSPPAEAVQRNALPDEYPLK